MSKDDLLSRLRRETRPLHDELERSVDIDGRIGSLARYADHLTRLWRLHVTAEQALCSVDFSPLGFSYPFPYRSSLLEHDLALIGIETKHLDQLDFPEKPTLETCAEGLGCMYVVEGSAKGARSILPAIKASLDLDAKHGASFFYGFGRETGRLWRACAGGITAIDPDSDEGNTLIQAARATFAMFRKGLVGEHSVPVYGSTARSEPISQKPGDGNAASELT